MMVYESKRTYILCLMIYFRVIRQLGPSSFFRIKLAPLNVPRHRRLETLAALAWITAPLIFGPICWIIVINLIIHTTLARYFAIGYLLWMYSDKATCEHGGRRFVLFFNQLWANSTIHDIINLH